VTCSKPPYSHARAIYLAARRSREVPTLAGTLRPYYCDACGYWHLSSSPDRRNTSRKREEAS
jgi:hypothetical protein